MSETERRYAQIEKEALATTWAFEKFADFVVRKHIEIETDHKPLVPLLGSKHLDCLPPRILRFHLRLDRFSYDINHVPGKELYTADTLSRAPLPTISSENTQEELAELCMEAIISHLPASNQRLETYRQAQSSDPICQQILKYCHKGWPDKRQIESALKAYWPAQGELTESNGLLMYGQRMVIPTALRAETLSKLHEGHQGIVRCRLRAKISVWWPGISKQLTSFIERCSECARDAKPAREPLIPTSLPSYPWQKVAAIFTLKGQEYLVIVDYFSRYSEVQKLKSTTTQGIVNVLKAAFARHGIPETFRSDNGPQFSSQEFKDFANKYNFQHCTSSPHFPSSNGQAERAVQTVKNLLKNATDPFLALLSYRATPLPWCGRSPSELFGQEDSINTSHIHNDSNTPMAILKRISTSESRVQAATKKRFRRTP